MKFFIILVITISLFFSCKEEKKDNKNKLALLWLASFVSQNAGDSYSEIFYMNSLFLSNKNYDLYFPVATQSSAESNTNKKLLIIHGWQASDKDVNSIANTSSLQKRLVETIWKDLFATNFLSLAITKGYDIYFYSYLTSETIASNSTRLQSKLQSVFGTQTNNVVFIAHSMGGLVARGAVYNFSSTPSFVNRIISLGTPYHGSPWASSQFQESKSILGELATYMTGSAGGKDLAWDNYDSSLSGSSNSYLSEMNAKSGRDNLIHAYYGTLDKSATGYAGSDSTLTPGCSSLGDTFSPSDCIVPQRSAVGTGLSFGSTKNLGAYHHTDINLRVDAVRTTLYNDLP